MRSLCIPVICLVMIQCASIGAAAKTAEDWYREGSGFSLRGKDTQAVRAYRRALEIKPEWAEAHHALAGVYYRMKTGVQAIFHLRRAKRLYRNRTDPAARRNLPIVRKNLLRIYESLGLDPEDFEEIETVRPTAPGQVWEDAGVGFLIGSAGHLIAPGHPLTQARGIRVRFQDGVLVPARLVRKFSVYDIALLVLDDTSRIPKRTLRLGDSARLREGGLVYGIDYDRLTQNPVIEGSIHGLKAFVIDDRMFQVQLPVKPAHSGGPLLNARGDVVGMIVSASRAAELFETVDENPAGIHFAIKSAYLRNLLPSPARARPGRRKEPEPAGPPEFSGDALRNFVAIEISK